MSARILHLHHFDGLVVNGVAFSIFDQDDNLVIDCAASGMSEADAIRLVNSWNACRCLSDRQLAALAEGTEKLDGAA